MIRRNKIFTGCCAMLIAGAIMFSCKKGGDTPTPEPPPPTPPTEESGKQSINELTWTMLDNDGSASGLLATGVIVPVNLSGAGTADPIAITGNGFKQGDLIAFRPIDKIDSSMDKTSPLTNQTDNAAKFMLPAGIVSDNYRLLLKRGSEEQKLGVVMLICDHRSDLTGMNVKGRVTASGSPLRGVVVSDGFKFTLTDSDGWYYMASEKEAGYVFIVLPSGYMPTQTIKTVPKIHGAVTTTGNVDEVSFTLKSEPNQKFHILAMTDIHLTGRTTPPYNEVAQFKAKVTPRVASVLSGYTQNPIYGVTMGDMTTDTQWYREGANFGLPQYLDVANTEFGNRTFFYCMGNHDNDPYLVGDWFSSQTYRREVGPSYYSYNIGNWHCISLDNIIYSNAAGGPGSTAGASDYTNGISSNVFEWLERDLAFVPYDTPVLIQFHCSLEKLNASDRARFMDIMSGYGKVHILSGHHHTMCKFTHRPGMTEHNNPPPMGVRWSVSASGAYVANDGSPGGFHVYTFDGNDVKWKFYSTDHGDYQFRTYDMNTVSAEFKQGAAANEVWINVFDWDEKWSITVKENGTPLAISNVTAQDPLYKSIHKLLYTTTSGMDFPNTVTRLMKVAASSASSTLSIEVRDRFGGVFTEQMNRPKTFTYTMK